MRVDGVGHYTMLGETVDDAAGEAFDKSAKLLGLSYPGGPALAKLAQSGNADAFDLPRPLLHKPNLDFSFAGLKTAVAVRLGRLQAPLSQTQRADMAASVQAAIVDVLCAKSIRALKATGLKRMVVAGGVGANSSLRERLGGECARLGARLYYPEAALCTDNGAMIALAAALRVQRGIDAGDTRGVFDVRPRWELAQA
jgi:N6-L-threonylcarbamoyladenine synthase